MFGLGTVLSMVGRLTFRTAGHGALAQALVNGIGVFTLIAAAELLERRRQRAGVPHAPAAGSVGHPGTMAGVPAHV